jgi:hypothetical protein
VFEYHEEHMPEKRERTITACKCGEERPSNEGLANRTPAERVADEDGHANEKTKRPVLDSDYSETSSAFADVEVEHLLVAPQPSGPLLGNTSPQRCARSHARRKPVRSIADLTGFS